MDLKSKPQVTRSDIASLLKSIASPGQERDRKIEAVKELEKKNFQDIPLHESLNSYEEF